MTIVMTMVVTLVTTMVTTMGMTIGMTAVLSMVTTMVMTMVTTRVMYITVMTTVMTTAMTMKIITMVMSMVMFSANHSPRSCLEIVLNFGDSLGIRWGFPGDSGYFRGIRMFLALQIMGDSPAELVRFYNIKKQQGDAFGDSGDRS